MAAAFVTQALKKQRGIGGKIVDYFSGWCYALTFSLVRLITFADMQHSVMFPMCVHVVI